MALVGVSRIAAKEATVVKSLYTKLEIPSTCHSSYKKGLEIFKQSLKLPVSRRKNFYSKKLLEIRQECHLYFSIAIFDAQGLFQQTVVIEYMLEKQYLWQKFRRKPQFLKLQRSNEKFFHDRFEHADLDPKLISKINNDWGNYRKKLRLFSNHLRKIARQKKRPILFSRFVFTKGISYPMTAWNYSYNEEGAIELNSKGIPLTKKGGYIIRVQRVLKNTYENAKEYIEWRPSTYFGEDSYMRGVLINKPGDSYREEKEKLHWSNMRYNTQMANKLQVKEKLYKDLEQKMSKKFELTTNNELKTLEGVSDLVPYIMATPVAMYLASFMAAKMFTAVRTANVAFKSFKYSKASLVCGANLSAALAAAPIMAYAGLGAHNAYQEIENNPNSPVSLTRALDQIIPTTMNAFKLSVVLPIAAPLTAGFLVHSAKIFALAGRSLLASLGSGWAGLKALGLRGSLAALPRAPFHLIKTWATAWWDKKILFAMYARDVGIMLSFELGMRELRLDTTQPLYHHKFWFGDRGKNPLGLKPFFQRNQKGRRIYNNPSGYNKVSLTSIALYSITTAISKPFFFIKSEGGRLVSYRLMDLVGSIAASLIIHQKLNPDRTLFDVSFGALVSHPLGEWDRKVQLSKFFYDKNSAVMKRPVLNIVYRMAFMAGWITMRNVVLDYYMSPDSLNIKALRNSFQDELKIDFSGFTDQEMEMAFVEFFKHPDTLAALANLQLGIPHRFK